MSSAGNWWGLYLFARLAGHLRATNSNFSIARRSAEPLSHTSWTCVGLIRSALRKSLIHDVVDREVRTPENTNSSKSYSYRCRFVSFSSQCLAILWFWTTFFAWSNRTLACSVASEPVLSPLTSDETSTPPSSGEDLNGHWQPSILSSSRTRDDAFSSPTSRNQSNLHRFLHYHCRSTCSCECCGRLDSDLCVRGYQKRYCAYFSHWIGR